jgi:hypothetical protein
MRSSEEAKLVHRTNPNRLTGRMGVRGVTSRSVTENRPRERASSCRSRRFGTREEHKDDASWTRSSLVKTTFGITAASIPWADSSAVCTRRQVTIDPGAPAHYPHQSLPFAIVVSSTRRHSVTGPVSTISTRNCLGWGKRDRLRQ